MIGAVTGRVSPHCTDDDDADRQRREPSPSISHRLINFDRNCSAILEFMVAPSSAFQRGRNHHRRLPKASRGAEEIFQ